MLTKHPYQNQSHQQKCKKTLNSEGKMFQPKTLLCFAMQVILDRELPIGTYGIPQHLQENMITLKMLKGLREEKSYLTQKLNVSQAKKEESQVEEDRFDDLAQEALPDQNLADRYLMERNVHGELVMKLELWQVNTQAGLRSIGIREKSLIIPEVYQNITFDFHGIWIWIWILKLLMNNIMYNMFSQ